VVGTTQHEVHIELNTNAGGFPMHFATMVYAYMQPGEWLKFEINICIFI
jgi:hypothetical protein